MKNEKLKQKKQKLPLVIAHRGASYNEKENSLKAYIKALKTGVDGIEMDLRMTKDKIVVCHHDRGVRNKNSKRYWLDDLTWAELKSFKNQEVLKFEDALRALYKYSNPALFSKFLLDLDLKQESMEKQISGILKKYNIKNVMVCSTDIFVLKEFEKVYPKADLALSYNPKDNRDLGNHKTVRFLALLAYYSLKPLLFRLIRRRTAIGDIKSAGLPYHLVSKKVVRFFREYNIKVFTWGTENEKKLKNLIELRVDGIKTKRPELLKKMLKKN